MSEDRKYSFFQHKECEYFPCHKTKDPESFNCLFCYCPLYALGRACGGNFEYRGDIKDCTNCLVPHRKENFSYITGKYAQIKEVLRIYDAAKEAEKNEYPDQGHDA